MHIGHLRTALEIRAALGLQQMLLMPSARPPHRGDPLVAAEHRFAMLAAAVDDEPGLAADDRELRRSGPSYTIDTLIDLRAEFGAEAPLCLCLGMDALIHLASWRRWRELTEFAHLVVAARPGWQAPTGGAVAEWLAERWVQCPQALQEAPCGRALALSLTLLPVSATRLREDLACGRSVRYLIPDAALRYLHSHQLYRSPVTANLQDR